MDDFSVKTFNLVKNFDKLTAVDGLSIDVKRGEIFGLLGPNGAGKSTTLKMLCTILKPTSGSAKINGFDVVKQQDSVRRSVGIVFQDSSVDIRLTGRENMDMHAELYDVDLSVKNKRIDELLKLVELYERADEPVKNYSGGMKRRLEMARGLIHHPKILFLDEPTLGLDPQTRGKIWEYIKNLKLEKEISIIITTHYMEEAETLCDRVGIIDHGKIVVLGTPKNLIKEVGEDIVSIKLTDNSKSSKFKNLEFIKRVEVGERLDLILANGAESIPKICRYAAENDIEIKSLELRTPTLNDVFLQVVGHELRSEHANGKDRMRTFMKKRIR